MKYLRFLPLMAVVFAVMIVWGMVLEAHAIAAGGEIAAWGAGGVTVCMLVAFTAVAVELARWKP